MDGVPASMDCDDADPLNFPGNDEVCDGQDNNCDTMADNDAIDMQTFYGDMDKDGFGNDDATTMSCQQPPDTASVGGDCNDNDSDAYPDANMICPLGKTCKAILDSGASNVDGLHLIDPDGVDVGQAPLEVWCDMTNGGATAALIINSINMNTAIGDFGAGYVSTTQLAIDPATASTMAAAPPDLARPQRIRIHRVPPLGLQQRQQHLPQHVDPAGQLAHRVRPGWLPAVERQRLLLVRRAEVLYRRRRRSGQPADGRPGRLQGPRQPRLGLGLLQLRWGQSRAHSLRLRW
ncbi:MAG: hypothetical protein HC927_10220 [Deltaproteobacteria bacterium]|nr:hypothetical protein [Deltaproteobacteria bacterium]